MKTLTVKLNIGIPGSGKSTRTEDFLKNNPNWVRISRDGFRYMFQNKGFTEPKIESLITDMQDEAILHALNSKLNVIVDDTNVKEKTINHFIKLVKYKANVVYEVFDIPLAVAIERDSKRERKVGEDVITEMYKNFKILMDSFHFQPHVRVSEHTKWLDRAKKVIDPTLPEAVIVDLDNTLCLMSNRSPFDWDKVGNDYLNGLVQEQLDFHKAKGRQIIVLTGRDGLAKTETIKWLDFYGIEYDLLLMKGINDGRKDILIKRELYEQEVKDKFNVICAYDDRTKIIKLWDSLGIPTFQVNNML